MDAREATRLAPTEPPLMMMGPGAAAFGGGMQNNPVFMGPHSASGMMQGGMRLPFNAGAPSVPKPAAETAEYEASSAAVMRPCGGFNLTEPVKKKRGRPRKYGLDGNVALALNTSPLSPASGSAGYSGAPSSAGSGKRKGRPPGSGKKQQMEALGAAGASFIPHVITVKAGEDVASKIMSFSQQGSRTVCILSANGAVSNVTLRQPATSGGTVTYEGRFEILSLSGSFMLTENGGTRSRSGGLSVALAGTDGRVLGGGVAGMLLAAAPVQVIVGSFISEVKKPALELANHDLSSATPQMSAMGFTVAPSPPSQGTSSGSSDEDGSPSNQTPGAGYSTSQPLQHVSGYNPVGWVGAHLVNQHRHEAK